MSKALRTVATIAGAAALIATGVGAVAVAGSALAATAGTVATIATITAGVAGIGAQITAPKPVARGSITNVIIASEPPRPCLLGRTYFAGVLRHQTGYGPTLKKVPNPYLWQVMVYSGVGPVQGLVEAQFDFKTIPSYYNTFYVIDSQLGARPEASALVPPLSAPAPNWGANHKLNGNAAIGWNFKFDKDGKRFASGVPVIGAIWDGVKVYDPRLDSTRPGGSGTHRIDDETTWTFSANPALHAGVYAYGRYENGVKTFGIGIPDDGIDWAAVAAWANDCDTNSWEVSGVIFEGGPDAGAGQRKRNLDDICQAGAGRWLMAGAVLSFDWQRPRVPLATFTDADIDEAGGDLVTLQSFRDRFNTVRPQFTDPDNNWQQVTAEPIVGSTYLTEDGQPKERAWPLNLVAGDGTQAGQLAAYAMADSREIGPITLTFGAEWRQYRPGDCLRWESDATGLESDLVIVQRSFDPATLKVTFTFKGETDGKHAFALGKTAVPPPTAIIGQTGEERDGVAAGTVLNPEDFVVNAVVNFSVQADAANVTTTTLPIVRQFLAFVGTTDVTTDVDWAVESATAGITATIGLNTGVLSLDVADANGTIVVSATYEGTKHFPPPVTVTRIRASGIDGGGSGSSFFSDGTWTNINSTSYVTVTDNGAIVQSNGSGELDFSASASYTGLGAARIKAQYSTDGISFTDAGSPATGTATTGGDDGFVSLTVNQTGLTPSTDYYVRLQAQRTAGSGMLEWIDPFFSVSQP